MMSSTTSLQAMSGRAKAGRIVSSRSNRMAFGLRRAFFSMISYLNTPVVIEDWSTLSLCSGRSTRIPS